MSEETSSNDAGPQITFNIKSSSDARHTITIAENVTVADLKQKLSSQEYADIPADRQRLIYSGRVMKDPDTLASYKIKDGNTVHMVKGAASNQQRNPETAGQSTSQSQVPPSAGVPQNLATGTGADPLAGLTGARYAGFAQMPGAGMFGPDGGMGAPQGPEEMLNMLENPMVQQQFNEAMNNPHIIQMLQNNPMIRDQPMMREMLNNPEMRRMLLDPQFIRSSMRMGRMMGGGPRGAQGGMPAPGVTDMTPQSGDQQQGQQNQQNQNAQNPQSPPNPFAGMPGMGGGMGGNPFAMLSAMGSMNPQTQQQQSSPSNPSQPSNNTSTSNQPSSDSSSNPSQQQQNQPNPFAGMFAQGQQGQQGQSNPIMDMASQMMQNPEMMRMAMNSMGGMAPGTNPSNQQSNTDSQNPESGQNTQQQPAFNPFSMLSAMQGGGGGGMGGMGAFGQQQDTRPPEQVYEQQLRQLNEMGLHDFDRNVRALRRSGGIVETAIEMLFSGQI
ncbi:MAG: hypothetical protein Q9162_002407 [Coniocarpon cinnabarinum]